LNIHPLNAPHGPKGPASVGQPSAASSKAAEPQADRVEISADAASSADSAEGAARQHRLEAIKDAITAGKYLLTDDAIAKAILDKASKPGG
jgi:anti-sigma28 factor (negative regulator of flagellin synthesis)